MGLFLNITRADPALATIRANFGSAAPVAAKAHFFSARAHPISVVIV
jgi:hypothetical protein